MDFSLAVKDDSSLWAWGLNRGRELGLGDRKTRPSPTRVGVANDWAQVACGWYGSLALKTDGSLWTWGEVLAQLGLGHHPSGGAGNVPTRVGTATDWAAVAAGEMHSLALKTDGSLWAWGYKDSGQLGLGYTKERDNPTRVGTASDWAAVACGDMSSLALRSDGSLWAWGANDFGQLGLDDTTFRYVPTRVGTAGDWAAVACGESFSLALEKDGSLWAWGNNITGELGLGDRKTRDVPTEVPSWSP